MNSRHLARLLTAAASVAALIALIAPAAQADTPAPGYSQFAGCPSPAENPGVEACVANTITGGHFKMGSKNVPISKPMTLSGGVLAGSGFVVANSKGGLTPVKQQVPGGIIGITGLDWLINFLSIEQLKLYAVTEVVGAPHQGETLSLPIRVHLINPALGNNCYVGSAANPIKLDLTANTTSPPLPNKPISGTPPAFNFDPETGILHLDDGVFVDNSFSAPGASGCVLTLFGIIPFSLNGLVNSQSGLPAAAGTNETVQEMDSELTSPFTVYP